MTAGLAAEHQPARNMLYAAARGASEGRSGIVRVGIGVARSVHIALVAAGWRRAHAVPVAYIAIRLGERRHTSSTSAYAHCSLGKRRHRRRSACAARRDLSAGRDHEPSSSEGRAVLSRVFAAVRGSGARNPALQVVRARLLFDVTGTRHLASPWEQSCGERSARDKPGRSFTGSREACLVALGLRLALLARG